MKIEDVYNKYSNDQIDEFEEIAQTKCCWGCKKRNKNCSDCELFFSERDKVVLLDYIEYLEKEIIKLKDDWALKRAELNSANQSVSILTQTKDSLERDKEVLEKALCNTCYLLYGTNDEHYPNWFKKQAKKELGDKCWNVK